MATAANSSPGRGSSAERSSSANSLWSGRTHFKILFKPAVIQVALIVLHVLTAVYIPPQTSWPWWDSWGQLLPQSCLVLASLYFVVIPLLRWRNTTFELTNSKVTKSWGVLYRHSLEIPLDRITSISVERGILDRIFGCGTLNFQDAASSGQATQGSWNRSKANKELHGVRFYDVPKVLEIKALIDNTRYSSN